MAQVNELQNGIHTTTNDDANAAEFRIRPPPDERFSKDVAKETVHSLLYEELMDKTYSSNNEENANLCKTLSAKIKDRLKSSALGRECHNYKLICNVVLAEQRGAGVRLIARCLWDSANDVVVYASYENDSLFCVASVFAVYVY